MTISVYTALNDGSHLLDGYRAQQHLTRGLGMTEVHPDQFSKVDTAFAPWRPRHAADIVLHPKGQFSS